MYGLFIKLIQGLPILGSPKGLFKAHLKVIKAYIKGIKSLHKKLHRVNLGCYIGAP